MVHLLANFADDRIGIRVLTVRCDFSQESKQIVKINGLAVTLDAVWK